jgi:hypothetical protein
MTAAEALRRARATDAHADSPLVVVDDCAGCEASTEGSVWDLAVNDHEPMGTWSDWHARCASALLDGFSVYEITAAEVELAWDAWNELPAGHTTDQPHE